VCLCRTISLIAHYLLPRSSRKLREKEIPRDW
jgi:hypothetical protein